MALSVAWAYNGSGTVTATITGASNGDEYSAQADVNPYPTDTGTVSGGTLTLTLSGISEAAGYKFDVTVVAGPSPYAANYVAATVFEVGATAEDGIAGVWTFNGTDTVGVTATFVNGVSYNLQIVDATNGGSTPTPFTGTGAPQTVSNTAASSSTGTPYFYAFVVAAPDFQVPANRMFAAGVAGAGTAGNPGGAAPVTHTGHGVCVAFGSDALDADPTYTSIDDPDAIDLVTGWRTKRGRTYLTDRTEAGTAEVEFIDTDGTMDPTNSGGPFYPMDPNCPLRIQLFHPIDEDWHTIYTGLVQNMPQTLDLSENFIRGSVNAADLFSLLAIDEIPPGLDFDATNAGTNTANTTGDTTYAAATVQDRIKAILADAGIPSGLTDIFSGNVDLQFTIYPAGTQTLAALQDSADAEFPTVANLYCDKDNKVVFHGRLARFDPTTTAMGSDWVYTEWDVGDVPAVQANPTWAVISGLEFDRDVAKVINAALVSPDGIEDADIAGQLSTDSGSITQYGNRVYTAQNLVTLGGATDGNDANEETKLYADYLTANLHDAQNRISQLTFRGVPSDSPYAAATWDMLCGVDIGDRVNVTTTHPGGGGFSAAPYYVEGISYDATTAGGANFQDVTMTLDLSPVAYFTTNPFS